MYNTGLVLFQKSTNLILKNLAFFVKYQTITMENTIQILCRQMPLVFPEDQAKMIMKRSTRRLDGRGHAPNSLN